MCSKRSHSEGCCDKRSRAQGPSIQLFVPHPIAFTGAVRYEANYAGSNFAAQHDLSVAFVYVARMWEAAVQLMKTVLAF